MLTCATHTRRLLMIASLAPLVGALPGCIIWDIHEDLKTTNEMVASVDSRLDQVEVTNEHLSLMQERLEVLESIDASLKKLDVHLASLRTTINNIDSTIPFLSISGDSDDEEVADPAADPTADPTIDPDNPATPTTDPKAEKGGGEESGGGSV